MKENSYLVRNIEAGNLLESLLVASVSTILTIRIFLHLTNYPQIGSGIFHIAHMLWGGFIMLISLVMLFTFLGRNVKRISAIIAGIGFGLFIDELGKFITRDNNYFYEPTIAYLYIVFMLMFFLFRYIEKHQELTQKEYLMNALQMLEETILNDMDSDEKKRFDLFVDHAGDYHHMSKHLHQMSENITLIPTKQNPIISKLKSLLDSLKKFIESRLFQRLIILFFIGNSIMAIIGTVSVIYFEVTNVPSITNYISEQYSVVGWGAFLSTLITTLLTIFGVAYLKFSKLKAYLLFKYSLLISILVTTFFHFYIVQFQALIGLTTNILLLIGINNMVEIELQNRRKIN